MIEIATRAQLAKLRIPNELEKIAIFESRVSLIDAIAIVEVNQSQISQSF